MCNNSVSSSLGVISVIQMNYWYKPKYLVFMWPIQNSSSSSSVNTIRKSNAGHRPGTNNSDFNRQK